MRAIGGRRAALFLLGATGVASLIALLFLWEGEPDQLLSQLQAAVVSGLA